MLGLQLTTIKADSEIPELFKDEDYQTFIIDFLSTSTVGGNGTVVSSASAPTPAGSLGINYIIIPGD